MTAADYFLKIAGIEGESTDAHHRGEIDWDSWSFGESQPAAPASPAAKRVQASTSLCARCPRKVLPGAYHRSPPRAADTFSTSALRRKAVLRDASENAELCQKCVGHQSM